MRGTWAKILRHCIDVFHCPSGPSCISPRRRTLSANAPLTAIPLLPAGSAHLAESTGLRSCFSPRDTTISGWAQKSQVVVTGQFFYRFFCLHYPLPIKKGITEIPRQRRKFQLLSTRLLTIQPKYNPNQNKVPRQSHTIVLREWPLIK